MVKNIIFYQYKNFISYENLNMMLLMFQLKQGGTLGNFIKWNFTKFIVDKNGVPVERHGPKVDPLDLVKSLEKYW